MPNKKRIQRSSSKDIERYRKAHGDVIPFTCPHCGDRVFYRWDNKNHCFYLSTKSIKQEYSEQLIGGV